jgi:chemotaxis protein CheD
LNPTPREFKEFEIGLGLMTVVRQPSILSISGIGSCIALAMRDTRTSASGLAHIVLPSSRGADDAYITPGKYSDTAVRALNRGIITSGGTIENIRAKLVGGARVLTTGGFDGTKNIESTRSELAKNGIVVLAEDVGEAYGRSMKFDTATGKIAIKRYQQNGGIAELKDTIMI